MVVVRRLEVYSEDRDDQVVDVGEQGRIARIPGRHRSVHDLAGEYRAHPLRRIRKLAAQQGLQLAAGRHVGEEHAAGVKHEGVDPGRLRLFRPRHDPGHVSVEEPRRPFDRWRIRDRVAQAVGVADLAMVVNSETERRGLLRDPIQLRWRDRPRRVGANANRVGGYIDELRVAGDADVIEPFLFQSLQRCDERVVQVPPTSGVRRGIVHSDLPIVLDLTAALNADWQRRSNYRWHREYAEIAGGI